MKITVDIDCTPKEARDFLGLPDIKPLQEAFFASLQEKISSGLSAGDMEKMMDLWGVSGMKQAGKNMEALQNIFWQTAQAKDK